MGEDSEKIMVENYNKYSKEFIIIDQNKLSDKCCEFVGSTQCFCPNMIY